MLMWHWFKQKKSSIDLSFLKIDVHSHLLPDLDDGVKTFDESINLIKKFEDAGFTKLITSPHVHELYRNTAQNILSRFEETKLKLKEAGIALDLQTAAEYNVDDWFLNQFNSNEVLLTFAEKYLLFETNFFAEPLILNDLIFKLKTKGFTPVMAHPERYFYLQKQIARLEDLQQRGVYFQLNLVSLAGAYGPVAEKTARELIDRNMIQLVGSDCHNDLQFELLKKASKHKYFEKVMALPLLNFTI